MLFATAAATAVLAITAPGAYANGDDWNHDDNAYSKEHDKDSRHEGPRGGVHTGGGALTSVPNEDEWTSGGDTKHGHDSPKEREHGKESWGGDHDKHDPEAGRGHDNGYGDHHKEPWKDEHHKDWKGDHDKGSWKDEHHNDSGPWKNDHHKPHGGMHTGGGALAAPAVTAGGLAVLAVAGTGMYAMRRKKSVGSVA